MSDAKGTDYNPLQSLEEAQIVPNGVVVLDGDSGGQIFLTCPARLIHCDAAKLRDLAADIDAPLWGYPSATQVCFECAKAGTGIWGGMGGGVVTEDLWLHPRLSIFDLEQEIRAVLAGKTARIASSTEQLLMRAKLAEPSSRRWPRRLADIYRSRMDRAGADDRAPLASMALSEYEIELSLSAHDTAAFPRLLAICEVALEAGQNTKAEQYANLMLRGAWRCIAQAESFFYVQCGEAIHKGHLVLGTVALRAGDLAAARIHLLEAGKAPWKTRNKPATFDNILTEQLLARGECDIVAKYHQLCARVWS